MSLSEMKSMSRKQLAGLCQQNGLPIDGSRQELLSRLAAKRLGGDRKHVHGHSLCPMRCGGLGKVTSTQIDRGVRYLKCTKCGYTWSSRIEIPKDSVNV